MASKRSGGKVAPPSQLQPNRTKKVKDQVICPICDETIVDPVGNRPGDDSIHCDGSCSAWLHRRCAGLTKSALTEISKSDHPFHCPHCRLNLQEMELKSLKDLVTNLSTHLSMVSDELTSVKNQLADTNKPDQSHSYADATKGIAASAAASSSSKPQHKLANKPNPTATDRGGSKQNERKFNIVIYGIDEQAKGTPKNVRAKEDHNNAGDILSTLDENVTTNAIRDCFRLGKYKDDHHRPLLVKLVRSSDASSILNNRKSLGSMPGISIKPDLSPQERRTESALLKERRTLINSGVERNNMKIRGSSLFINNIKYGYVTNSIFQKCTDTPENSQANRQEATTDHLDQIDSFPLPLWRFPKDNLQHRNSDSLTPLPGSVPHNLFESCDNETHNETHEEAPSQL